MDDLASSASCVFFGPKETFGNSNDCTFMDIDTNQTRSILVIEDDPLIRMHAALALEDAHFRVIEAGDADEGLRCLETAPDIDLLFTDIHMPGPRNGLELALLAETRWPALKIILTSGRDGTLRPASMLFVAKPYNIFSVVTQIQGLLGPRPC